MEEKYLEIFIKAFIEELFNESKSLFTGIFKEGKQFINKGLKEYLYKQKSRYSYIKTLLHGNVPVYLYNIYYPIKLKSNGSSISTESISNVFKKSNYISIFGDAGIGKSTLVKHLFLNSIKENYAIPILIELRYLNEFSYDFHSYILDKIFESNLAQNEKILDRLLSKGKFVFFLDGFDELKSNIRTSILDNLNSFLNKYHKNKFLITTRPYSNLELLPLFFNYYVKELSKSEVNGFIYKQLSNEIELAKKITSSLEGHKSLYLSSFLKNPLLLIIYIITFQSNSTIPTKKYIFYRRVVNALFSEHDSKSKIGFVREKSSNLTQEQFEDILKRFSFLSFFDQRFDFDEDYLNKNLSLIKSKSSNLKFNNKDFITDLKLSIALMVEDNGLITFSHRSLQEYFACLYLTELNDQNKKRVYNRINKSYLTRSSINIPNFL